jgi:phosphate transport system substrate-binding protein
LSVVGSVGRARLVRALVAVGLSATLVAGVTAPAAQARPASSSTLFINAGGSTFIQPLMIKWKSIYQNTVNKYVAINYQGVGSGAGITSLTKGLLDFACTDAFMNDDQIKAAGGDIIHVPMTIGPVALIYNLPGFKGTLKLDGPTLAQIYMGKITSWNDKAIASLNAGVTLPSTPIVPVHRADGSGTTFITTNYLSAVSSDFKSSIGAGTLVTFPSGQGGKGSPGVAAIVSQSPGAIGYVELSYALLRNLPTVAIKNKAGNFLQPSVVGAAKAAANAPALPGDLRGVIVDAPGPDSYPITGITWAILHQHQKDLTMATAVVKFLWWAINDGQRYSTSGNLRYAPLPSSIVKLDEAKLSSVTVNGKQVYNGK